VCSSDLETVKNLYRRVRPQARYERSLEQIRKTKEYGKRTKTGIMLGLGESKDEVFEAMDHLAENGCDILTLGQYLQPTKMHHEVIEFIHPDIFDLYREEGLKRGIKYVESGPLVRSSYHSERHVNV
jgi:lipoic acid synthetase